MKENKKELEKRLRKICMLEKGEKIINIRTYEKENGYPFYKILIVNKLNLVWSYTIFEYSNYYQLYMKLVDTSLSDIEPIQLYKR